MDTFKFLCPCNSVVEYLLGKEEVTSSNLVTGFYYMLYPSRVWGLSHSKKISFALSFRANGFLVCPKPPQYLPSLTQTFCVWPSTVARCERGFRPLARSVGAPLRRPAGAGATKIGVFFLVNRKEDLQTRAPDLSLFCPLGRSTRLVQKSVKISV